MSKYQAYDSTDWKVGATGSPVLTVRRFDVWFSYVVTPLRGEEPTPKAFHNKAQGQRRSRATLGNGANESTVP